MRLFCVCILAEALRGAEHSPKESYHLWEMITELNKRPGPRMGWKSHWKEKESNVGIIIPNNGMEKRLCRNRSLPNLRYYPGICQGDWGKSWKRKSGEVIFFCGDLYQGPTKFSSTWPLHQVYPCLQFFLLNSSFDSCCIWYRRYQMHGQHMWPTLPEDAKLTLLLIIA
jgi:hypothetical protein